jgi:hypothetical protein
VAWYDLEREPDELRAGIFITALPAFFTRRGFRLWRRERLPDLEFLDAADPALEHEDAQETDRRMLGGSSSGLVK